MKMNQKNGYRLYPIIFISFLRVCVSFTLELAIPLYYLKININPFLIGVISSGTSMIYLFSPILLKNIYKKIGIKNALLVSVIGTLVIQIVFQFSLEPWLVYPLLILEGLLLGLFWPVLITTISLLSKMEGVCEDESEQDKLVNRYNVAWNAGAILSYFLATIILFIFSFVELIFILTLVYSILMLFFTIFFEEPKAKKDFKEEIIITKDLETKCRKENIEFPTYLPLYIIMFYGFLIGALILLYPVKSEALGFAVFTTYLLNFLRMTAQTISISKLTSLSINALRKLFFISLPAMLIIFLLLGFFDDLFIFALSFIGFGFFGSILYTFSFKLTVYRNLIENTSKYSSYFETSSGIGFFLSPIISGFIADLYINGAFYFTSLIILLVLIFSVLFSRKIRYK